MDGSCQDPPNTLKIAPHETAWIHVQEPSDGGPDRPGIRAHKIEPEDLHALAALRTLRGYFADPDPYETGLRAGWANRSREVANWMGDDPLAPLVRSGLALGSGGREESTDEADS